MPKGSLNMSLKGADDIFSTEESRQEQQREQVQQIPIGELHPFTNHPFKVVDDEAMTRTVESIAQFGVLAPLIARPRPDGDGYEIISGHRRQFAAKMAGLETLPVIVRNMDDDAATILMVDSNLQREHISPSERAFAYKMKMDAMKRTAGTQRTARHGRRCSRCCGRRRMWSCSLRRKRIGKKQLRAGKRDPPRVLSFGEGPRRIFSTKSRHFLRQSIFEIKF